MNTSKCLVLPVKLNLFFYHLLVLLAHAFCLILLAANFAVADENACPPTTTPANPGDSPTLIQNPTTSWSGGAGNTDWFVKENWNKCLPAKEFSVSIIDQVNKVVTIKNTGAVASSLDLGQGSTLNLLSGGSLTTTNETILGKFLHSGGTNTTGTETITGDVIAIDKGYIQTGGIHIINNSLTVNGKYTLSNGTLNVKTDETVGIDSAGVFTQNKGDHIVTGKLILGTKSLGVVVNSVIIQTPNSNETAISSTPSIQAAEIVKPSGTYKLNDGKLTVTNEIVGDTGIGIFNQSGGNHVVSADLTLAKQAGSEGTYNLSGGILKTNNTIVGTNATGSTAHFEQSGGSNTIAEKLTIDTNGSYALSGNVSTSTLTAKNEDVKNTFTQSGGTNTVNSILTITGGSYTLSDGALNAKTVVNNGQMTQQGGTVSIGDRLVNIVDHTYTFSGGEFSGKFSNFGNLVFDVNTDAFFGASITNLGFFIKRGNGKVTLENNSDLTRGTTLVSDGTLTGDTSSLTGNIINNANVTFVQATSGAFNGVMSGSGSLTKQNSGTLTLTGNNTYRGDTNLNAGTISVNDDSNLGDKTTGSLNFNGGILQITGTNFNSTSRPINWGTQGGGFDIADPNNTFTLNQVLGGQGGLTKLGDGTLILSGKNFYTGGTTVSGGVLQGNTDSLQGNIVNNANVTFDQAIDGVFNGVMSGSGSLTKQNGGTLTLTGNNSYGGGTNLSAGTVSVSSDSNLGASTSALNFNGGSLQITGTNFKSTERPITWGTQGGGFDIVDAASIFKINQNLGTGGSLLKKGAGMLVLNGANAYNGAATVNAGNLQIGDDTHSDASINGPVTIDPAGTLSGHGTINGDVFNSGILSPGGSIGTLTVNGNVSFARNSLFNVEINPQQASLLNVSGLARLGNANVSVLANPGTYTPRTYTILNANAVTGRFAGVSIINPTISPSLFLLTPALHFLPNRVDLSLDAVTDPMGALPWTDIKLGKNRDRLISGRLNAPLGISCAENRNGFWARGLGMLSSAAATGTNPGYDGDTSGAIFGYDRQLGQYLSLGIAAFTSHTDVTTHQVNGNHSSSDTAGASLYGVITPGPWQLKTVLSYDNSSYSAQSIIPQNVIQRRAQSKTQANHLSSYDELSYSFKSGDFTLQPLVGLNLGWLQQNGFSEQGGTPGQNLSVDGRTIYTLDTFAGLRVRQELEFSAKLKAQFEVHAIYDHDFSTMKQATTGRFDNGTAGLIKTADRPDQRDGGILGASFSLLTADSLNFYLDYNGEIRGGQNTHFFNAGIRYSW